MPGSQLRLQPGAVVVFEGLDRTGKSTQLNRLAAMVDSSTAVFAHMPSGFTPFTNQLYEALEAEGEGPASGFAKQLTHLACHAENMASLTKALRSKGLVLDRWWWSTLAYGWYGGSVERSGLSEKGFRELIHTIWAPIVPAVVFVFLKPHQMDGNNADGVEDGYRALMAEHIDLAVVVPPGGQDETLAFIVDELVRRDVTVPVELTGGPR